MKVHDCTQGSQEWLKLRSGIPTSSQFARIITPTGKPSKSSDPYMHALIAERYMGRPLTEHVSFWMERGSALEAEAVAYYEHLKDTDTEAVGFVTNDAGTIGESPDRLVGEDGLLEIKCPAPHTHVQYLMHKPVDRTYYPQIMGQLWICEREWVDILSYHPGMPPALVRTHRDEPYIKLLAGAVTSFSDDLERQWELLRREHPPEEPDPLELQFSDLEVR